MCIYVCVYVFVCERVCVCVFVCVGVCFIFPDHFPDICLWLWFDSLLCIYLSANMAMTTPAGVPGGNPHRHWKNMQTALKKAHQTQAHQSKKALGSIPIWALCSGSWALITTPTCCPGLMPFLIKLILN